ncbi:MAG TPA: glycosyltransferase family 9 protein [Methylomirabilota bacterium]|nr:glycosyltransferase family 9 protein [Methylomirabilota bacterium]
MKILVIALAGIGDTLIATPFIHELRVNFPRASLHALVLWPGAKDLLEGNPHLDAIHQRNLIKEGPVRSLRYLLGLRRERYDISINVHTLGRIHYRVVARLIGAKVRISHEYENHGWVDRFLVNRTVPQDYSIHSVENNNRLLGLLGVKPVLSEHPFELFLTPAEREYGEQYVRSHQLQRRKVLGVHVGSGGTKNLALKRWPLDHYVALLQRLAAERPEAAVLLFGGPEEEQAHAELRRRVSHPRMLIPATRNLREVAALMSHCTAFLSVDTALMHLAAAMKVPNQIVIEAPTLNATNMPWQNACRVIRNPAVNGRNLDYYRYDGRPIKGTEAELLACMRSIGVDEVYQAVASVL